MNSHLDISRPGPSVTTVVHDIASPMTLIRLNLDMMADKLVTSNTPPIQTLNLIKYVRRAITGVDRVKNIINVSLDDQYGNQGKETFGVKAELNAITRIFKIRIDREQVQLKVIANAQLKLTGSKQVFCRIISNLVTNSLDAFKTLEPGSCPPDKQIIQITALISSGHLIISFEDNAGGIPLPIQKYLFKQQYTTKAQGHGLGLLNVKMLIEKHFAGNISCFSIRDQGTVFAIAFPICRR